jgi:hypothetical protein
MDELTRAHDGRAGAASEATSTERQTTAAADPLSRFIDLIDDAVSDARQELESGEGVWSAANTTASRIRREARPNEAQKLTGLERQTNEKRAPQRTRRIRNWELRRKAAANLFFSSLTWCVQHRVDPNRAETAMKAAQNAVNQIGEWLFKYFPLGWGYWDPILGASPKLTQWLDTSDTNADELDALEFACHAASNELRTLAALTNVLQVHCTPNSPAATETRRKVVRKRQDRAAKIDALTSFLADHLLVARDYAFKAEELNGEPRLMPRPTQKELAEQTKMSESDVSRCLKDPGAKELRIHWEVAVDLDQVMAFKSRRKRRARS